MRATFAVVAAMCVSVTAGAVTLPEAPAGGSTLEDLDQNRFQCRAENQQTQCRRRGNPADRIEGEPVTEIVLFYRDNRLVRSVFSFSEAHLDQLVRQLTLLLGAPVAGNERLKAGMAGVFENRYYLWKHNGRAWFVEQFFERITDSGLWRMSEAELDALLGERERQRVRGARDL